MYTCDSEKLTMFCLCMITVVLLIGGNRHRKQKEMFKFAKSVLKILYA